MNPTLRAACARDIAAMYTISCDAHRSEVYRSMIPVEHYDHFAAAYTPNAKKQAAFTRRMTDVLRDPQANIWVAEIDGTVVGYTLAGPGRGVWLLKGLFVAPEYQGQGIGRQLFRTSYRAAPPNTPVELKVIASNARAIRMYEQEGFVRVGLAEEVFFGAVQDIMRRDRGDS